MLRLWLCGRFAGEFDGVAVSMPASDRARALIGWLALRPGTHPRSYLAARLWVPVLLVSCLAARAHLLARLGRHDEAQETARQQRDCAGRLDDPGFAATAAYDGGLGALAAGRRSSAWSSPPVSWPGLSMNEPRWPPPPTRGDRYAEFCPDRSLAGPGRGGAQAAA